MWNLIKYEFSRKAKLLSILLISAVVLNVLAVLKFSMGGSALVLVFIPFVISIVFLAEVIKTYGDDVNKKSGYMLFMTPNSGYKIISAKIITVILEGLLLWFVFGIFAVINGIYIMYETTLSFSFLSEGFTEIVHGMNMLLGGQFGITIGHLFVMLFIVFICIISFITTVYAAITIRKSVFSDIKFGGLFSFIIFIILNVITDRIANMVMDAFGKVNYFDVMPDAASMPNAMQMFVGILPFSITTIAFIVLFVAGSGYLLERKINL